jgi:hypothetical protein
MDGDADSNLDSRPIAASQLCIRVGKCVSSGAPRRAKCLRKASSPMRPAIKEPDLSDRPVPPLKINLARPATSAGFVSLTSPRTRASFPPNKSSTASAAPGVLAHRRGLRPIPCSEAEHSLCPSRPSAYAVPLLLLFVGQIGASVKYLREFSFNLRKWLELLEFCWVLLCQI